MKLYYTISEVSQQMGVNPSHLRFLETEFKDLKPQTDKRGVRRYTQADIDLIQRILYLTKERGYTLDGARQQLRASRRQQQLGSPDILDEKVQLVENLTKVRQFLVELKEQL